MPPTPSPPKRATQKQREHRLGQCRDRARLIERLADFIREIAVQATRSNNVAGRAVTELRRTVNTMSELGSAANRIGEVISLN